MREFMRGEEWWGLREDGSWVRWNRETLEWEPQAAPPAGELQEIDTSARAERETVSAIELSLGAPRREPDLGRVARSAQSPAWILYILFGLVGSAVTLWLMSKLF